MILFVIIIFVSYGFGIIIIICEFGQRMTNAFEQIDNKTGKFKWYLFPRKLQRMLLIILIKTQQPVELRCFGSVSATRENSKKVSFDLSSFIIASRTIFNSVFSFINCFSDIQGSILIFYNYAQIYKVEHHHLDMHLINCDIISFIAKLNEWR